MVKLVISLDPLGSLYSSASTRPRGHLLPSGGPEDVEVVEQSLKSFKILVVPSGHPPAPSNPVRPERSRPHHSYYEPSGCLRTIFPKVAIVLQKDARDEMVDARVWRQVKEEGRQSPVTLLESLPLEGVAKALRSHSRGSQRALDAYSPGMLKLVR